MKKITIIIIALVSCLILACLLYFSNRGSLYQSVVTENLTKTKSISKGISNYYDTNNKYPDSLQQLVDEKILTREDIELDELTIYYMKGCKPGVADQITFYTSTYAPEYGSSTRNAIVAYTGDKTEIVEQHDLDTLLAREIQKLQTAIYNTHYTP